MIKTVNINKSFGDQHVLKDINIRFEPGKTNLIIGRSGSGKTVLLKSIVRLHEIDSGQIFFDDIEISRLSRKELKTIRQQMGMVFQGGALFDSFTVAENIRYPMDMFTKMSRREKKERVDFCLDHVNLQKAHKLFPAEISGGMKKRVAIARAIALNPKYLFCDEPNSGLDPNTSILIDNLIHDITEEFKMTTIINTHDMNSVMEIGDKIVFINEGKKHWEGTKDEVMHTSNKELNDFIFVSALTKSFKEEAKK